MNAEQYRYQGACGACRPALGVGDRPQLAGCAGARFATAAIAQLNPDSFVTNNGSHRDTDAPHMHALPARVCIAAAAV